MTRTTQECQRIVITGITRGLGRAMAERFAELGHTVAGCGRSHTAIKELETLLGKSHHVAALDVTHDQAVKAWAQDVVARFGPPDLLINNAAVINRNAALWDVPAAEFDRVVDINIKGVANVIRHFVPAMIARGRGVIVNFSSGWGRSTSPGGRPLLRHQVGDRGLDPRPRPGIAPRPRRHPPEPGNH